VDKTVTDTGGAFYRTDRCSTIVVPRMNEDSSEIASLSMSG
jgi:hypothetical protein